MESTLEEAMEGTKLQRFAPDLGLFVTWHGSLTFNVWAYEGGSCREVDVWTMAEPLSFEEAVQSMDEHFAMYREELES